MRLRAVLDMRATKKYVLKYTSVQIQKTSVNRYVKKYKKVYIESLGWDSPSFITTVFSTKLPFQKKFPA